MKKILGLFITLAAFATSFQSHAGVLSLGSLNRSCQSQGEIDNRMVYIDLYQDPSQENSYNAVFSEAKTTSSKRINFLVVQDIQRNDSDSRIGNDFYAYDKEGVEIRFSLVPDSEDLSSTYSQFTHVTYYYKGDMKSGTFSCDHALK